MSISFGSISTGLPKDIVKQIIAAEKIPITKMEDRKSRMADKTKLLGELIDLFQKLQADVGKVVMPKDLRELSIITNNDLIDVTTDKQIAEVGDYKFEVVELAEKSSAMSSGFRNPDESYIGVGYIQYTLPSGEVRDLYVDQENASLRGVAKLINSDPNSPMRATIVNDGSDSETPWRLILTLNETGDEHIAEFPYFYFVDGEDDFYLESERKAHDAKVKLDGFEIEIPSNSTSEIIPGLTINLKKARPGEEFDLKIREDTKAITDKMVSLVEKINAVLQFIQKENAIDDKTDTTRTLGGDLSLQQIENRIRALVFKPILTSDGYKKFGDLAVSFQRTGLLKLDSKKFDALLAKNPRVAMEVLTGFYDASGVKHEGFLGEFSELVYGVLRRPDGVLELRKTGLQNTMSQIDRQIENRQRIIDQKEIALKDKFSRLETAISKIRNQGAGLAALTGGGDPVTQLGDAIGGG